MTIPGNSNFEEIYLTVRNMEGRVYTDEQVAQLPYYAAKGKLRSEWRIRACGTREFSGYLSRKPDISNILEVGCGNGWFSAYLAKQFPDCGFTGMDVNVTELDQAGRVHHFPNLTFEYGDLFTHSLVNAPYQLIFLASSVQYFKDIQDLIRRLCEFGSDGLEIHIRDSPIYQPDEIREARKRSATYYDKMGCPGMKNHYFHHSWDDLAIFNPDVLQSPSKSKWKKGIHRILGREVDFPWIVIKKIE